MRESEETVTRWSRLREAQLQREEEGVNQRMKRGAMLRAMEAAVLAEAASPCPWQSWRQAG